MRISTEQFNVFEQQIRQNFYRDLYQALQSNQCTEIRELAQVSVLDKMAVWHKRALDYGIVSERAVGRFLGIHLIFKPDFDLGHQVMEFLTRTDLTGDQKMTMIYSRMKKGG